MEKLNINIASKTIEIAEHENYLELLNRVCYLKEPNGNDTALVYNGTEEDMACVQTLVDMPVVARYVVDQNGEDNLGSHEAYIDENGDLAFATVAIGVHTDVYVADDAVTTFSGETKTLPCVFAKQRIWKRNKCMVAAVKHLSETGELHNSWELCSSEYLYKDGIKYITKYAFLSNCFLGSDVMPAYGKSAEVLSLSQKTDNAMFMVAEALAQDMKEQSDKETEGKDMKKNAITKSETEEKAEMTVVTEGESVTHEKAAEPENPVEQTEAVADATDEADDVAKKKKGCAESEAPVTDESSKTSMEDLVSALADANATIESLRKTIAELEPYRTAHEQAEAERIRLERESAIAELRQYVVDSNKFTEEELAPGSEISALVEDLNKDAIKGIIADRVIAEMRTNKPSTETASTKTTKVTLESEPPKIDPVGAFRDWLKN